MIKTFSHIVHCSAFTSFLDPESFFSFFFFKNLFIFGCAAHRLSLVVVNGGISLIVVHGLLIVVASTLPEHGL